MLNRVLPLACAFLALALLVSGPAVGGEKDGDKDKTHEGKVVSVKGNKLTMETKGKEHSHEVAATAKITCDGKPCKLTDLKPGFMIRVTTENGDRVTRIEAKTKGAKDDVKDKDKD